MEEESGILEDGEVIESDNNPTTTNQFTLSRATREPQTINSEESSNEKSDNSDEDSDNQCSKPKMAKSECLEPEKKGVPNKFKVWSLALQEETLMDNLKTCGVETIDGDRNVESYNYKKADKTDYSQMCGPYHMPVSECHFLESEYVNCTDERKYLIGSKRRMHISYKNRRNRKDRRHGANVRRLPHLVVTAESPVEDVAEEIALKLNESKVDLILNIVLVLGKEKAIELYNETKGIEENGGMLIMNQERRRTPGGVYLLLLKRDESIKPEAMKEIFADDVSEYRYKKKLVAKKRRKKNIQDIKETLIREKLLCLNTTNSVEDTTACVSEVTEHNNEESLEESELKVSNPPPSPATDRDSPPPVDLGTVSDDKPFSRPLVNYDNDDAYLEVDVSVDDMDFL